MGGWTKVMLKDTSPENVARHNAKLEIFGVPKQYRYQTFDHAIVEYEWYLAKQVDPSIDATYMPHLFPPDQINSFEDFTRFWNSKAVGECFVPPVGALTFDCYFGRMSKRAMRAVSKYLITNMKDIDAASIVGSFDTFMEKGMTEDERNQWRLYWEKKAA